MKEGTSIDVHLDEMLKLVSEVQSAGAEISDSKFHTCILFSLPQSFANQKATLECIAKVDMDHKIAYLRNSRFKWTTDNIPEETSILRMRLDPKERRCSLYMFKGWAQHQIL